MTIIFNDAAQEWPQTKNPYSEPIPVGYKWHDEIDYICPVLDVGNKTSSIWIKNQVDYCMHRLKIIIMNMPENANTTDLGILLLRAYGIE